MMKFLAIGLLYFGCLFAMAQEPKNARLIILSDFDPDRNGAIEKTFMMALIDQSAPLLVHYKVLDRFYQSKKYFHDAFVARSTAPESIRALDTIIKNQATISNLTAAKDSLSEVNAETFVYYQIQPSKDEWLLYDCPGTCFLLFVPKKHTEMESNPALLSQKLGLQIQNFKSIPLPAKSVGQASILKDLQEIATTIAQSKKPVAFATRFFDSIFITNSTDFRWNIFEIGHGLQNPAQIAGMPAAEFANQLLFFNKKLNVNIFFYFSCYSGDEKLLEDPFTSKLDTKNPRSINYNFTIISAVTTDLPGHVLWLTALDSNAYKSINGYVIPVPSFDFSMFFKLAETSEYLDKTISYVTNIRSRNIPLMRLPGTDFFRTSDWEKKVFVLSRTRAIAAFTDNKTIEVPASKIALIIEPEIIPGPLIIHNEGTESFEILFRAPAAKRYFSQLTVDNLNKFIKQDLAEMALTVHDKILYIKQLVFPAVSISKSSRQPLRVLIDKKNRTQEFLLNRQTLSLADVIIKIPGIGATSLESPGLEIILKKDNAIYKGRTYVGSNAELRLESSDDGAIQKLFDQFTYYQQAMKDIELKASTLKRMMQPKLQAAP